MRADTALSKIDRTTRLLRVLGLVLGVYAAVAVTVASVFGVVNSFRAVDYARLSFDQARRNGDVAALIRSCVETTPDGQEPSKCVRDGDARTAKAVSAIVDADGNGTLDALEVRAALERIERAVGASR